MLTLAPTILTLVIYLEMCTRLRVGVMLWDGCLFIRIADVKKLSTTTSIMKDIFKTDRLTNKNAALLSLSGSKSVLHRFM